MSSCWDTSIRGVLFFIQQQRDLLFQSLPVLRLLLLLSYYALSHTGFLGSCGIRDVAQLDGGIVTYGKDPEVQGKLWDGQCYVFDERISVPVNRVEHVIVGKDYFTGERSPVK